MSYTLEDIYLLSDSDITKFLLDNSYSPNNFLLDRYNVTIILNNNNYLDVNDIKYVNNDKFQELYFMTDNELSQFGYSNMDRLQIIRAIIDQDIISSKLEDTKLENTKFEDSEFEDASIGSSISSFNNDFNDDDFEEDEGFENEGFNDFQEDSIDDSLIYDIIDKYTYKPISVIIEKESNNIANIYLNLERLNKDFVDNLLININEPVVISIIKSNNNIKIRHIFNAGLTEFQLNSIKSNNIKDFVDSAVEILLHPGKKCPFCQETHLIEGVRPVSCTKNLCMYQGSEIGLGIDIKTIIMNNGEVVDLLWNMLYTVVTNSLIINKNMVDPYPELYNNNLNGLKLTLERLPPIEDIQNKINSFKHDFEINKYINDIDPNIPYLIKWLFGTLRINLIYTTTKPENLNTCNNVFRILSDTPEREILFNNLKSQYSVIEGYHGSPGYNWHSILRHQLQNLSGTEKQIHGAVHGSGIYLAIDKKTAEGYASTPLNWPNSKFNNRKVLISAEIINNNVTCVQDFCYVVPKEEQVSIKYLCLF